VLDALRLIPISKAIIEITPQDMKEARYKGITNGQGLYSLSAITPGMYDIRIKHPRFLPLILTNYKICANEDKLQSFLLHRV